MTSGQKARFALWFAWRDLKARHALVSTVVIVLTVALVVGLTLVAVGLVRGQEAARLHDLKGRPLAIWVGSTLTRGGFTPEIRAALDRELAGRIPGAAGYSVHPFRQIYLLADHRDGNARPRVGGRTATADDPLLGKIRFRRGGAFTSDTERGVIITPKMLTTLGYSEGDDVPAVGFQVLGWPADAIESVPVIGVTREPLPLGYEYLLPEGYAAVLLTRYPKGEFGRVVIGPVPRALADPAALPPAAAPLLQRWKENRRVKDVYTAPVDSVSDAPRTAPDGRTYWQLEAAFGTKMLPLVWADIVSELADNLHAAKFLTAAERGEFRRIDFIDAEPGEKPRGWESHDAAGVFVTDLNLLDPAAEACRAVGLGTNDDLRRDRKEIGAWAEQWWRLIRISVPVAALAGFTVLMFVNGVRARRKVTEIGMLKGIGVTGRLIRLALLAEAGLVWLAGAGIGVAAGTLAGYLIAWQRATDPNEWTLGFACPTWAYAVTLGLAAVACWASLRLGTRRAVREPAIISLSRPSG